MTESVSSPVTAAAVSPAVPAAGLLAAPAALPVTWCADQQQLDELCAHWRRRSFITLDTEFERTRTFWPTLALVQVCDGEAITLIDALAVRDWTCFAALLADQNVVKVMHAAGEDLEAFQVQCQALPWPLFDTQNALAWLSEGYSLGLSATVDRFFGATLDKDQARTDWLARPLSDAQLKYAAADVLYLPSLYAHLAPRIAAATHLARMQADAAAALARVTQIDAPEWAYRRLKAAFVLRGPQLAVARELCIWREREARQSNTARSFLLKDDVLLAMAQSSPKNWNALAAIDGLHPRVLRVYGKDMLAAIARGLDCPREQQPLRVRRLIDVANGRELLDALVAIVAARAAQEALTVELYCSRRVLEQLILNVADTVPFAPAMWQGWRRDVFSDAFAEAFRAQGFQLPEWW